MTHHSRGSVRRARALARRPSTAVAAGVAAALLGAAPAGAAAPNQWTAVGSLATPRYQAAAGLLPSGKVLVTGGTDSSANALASTEIFDPPSGTWASGPDMSGGRVGAVAVTLRNGDVLVAGGEAGGSGASPDTGEVYDPGTDTFTPVGNTMSDERFGSMASLLPDGDVLIAGGSGAGGPTQSADLYDPATNLFLTGAAAPPPMSTPRQDAEAITLSNGDVLVAGGSGDDTAELYDPAANRWTATANAMSTPRAVGGIAPLPAGRVLLAGGEDLSGNAIASTDIYDPVTNTFTAGPPLNVGRLGFGMVPLPNGDVLVAGGLDRGTVPPPIFAGQTEIYDPSHNRWSLTDNVVQPAFELTMARLGNGQVLATGGVVNIFGQATGATEVFTPPSSPAAPGDVSATAGDGSAQVTFAPPSSDNGAPVTGYIVTASTGQSASTPDGRTVATVTGLRNGTPVTFTVVATNAEGTGPLVAGADLVEHRTEAVEHGRRGAELVVGELRQRCGEPRGELGVARVHQRPAVLGQGGEDHAAVALGPRALHEARGGEPVEHARGRRRREVGQARELARRQRLVVDEAEQQPVLGVRELAVGAVLAPPQPPHRAQAALQRPAELPGGRAHVHGEQGRRRGLGRGRGHAATASASASSGTFAAAA
jgi:hypothetical protein